jgi:hypothetical protein
LTFEVSGWSMAACRIHVLWIAIGLKSWKNDDFIQKLYVGKAEIH